MNRLDCISKPLMWSTTILLAAILAGCGGGKGTPVTDTGPAPIGSTCSGTGCVDLKTAGNYVILTQAGITYTPTATVTSTHKITGNMGVSPAAASTITGFALELPAGGAYSVSTLVNGAVFAPGYAPPTPANLTTAIGDRQLAYDNAGLMTASGGTVNGVPGVVCPGVGILNATTITPGVYHCANPVSITGNVTLDGAGVYVFLFDQTLTQDASTQVILSNGALPENVFWRVGGAVSVGASAKMKGVLLTASSIALVTSAEVTGRLLSKTSVAMNANTVTQP
jgi:hypothetical protein